MSSAHDHPLDQLSREDQDLVLELVLRSGSLKEVAIAYGVSYPTLRLRLDRVIARLRSIVDGRRPDPLSEMLAGLVERGEISVANARAVRDAARLAGASGSLATPNVSASTDAGATTGAGSRMNWNSQPASATNELGAPRIAERGRDSDSAAAASDVGARHERAPRRGGSR